MQLDKAKLCLDCGEVGSLARCEACQSAATWPLARWLGSHADTTDETRTGYCAQAMIAPEGVSMRRIRKWALQQFGQADWRYKLARLVIGYASA